MDFFGILFYAWTSLFFATLAFIFFVCIPRQIARDMQEKDYESKQKNELALLASLLHDKKLWKWSENHECIQCQFGDFRAEIRPYGFYRSYTLNIWAKEYESDHSRKVLSIIDEDGVQKVREHSFFTDENTLQIIQSIPLEKFAASFLTGQKAEAPKEKYEKMLVQTEK